MARKKVCGIYRILNTTNNKSYIGYSTFIHKRWDNHKQNLRKGTHKCNHLQSSWIQYGESSFEFHILEELPLGLTKQEYEKFETVWVIKFNTIHPKFGYNEVLPGNLPVNGKPRKVRISNKDNRITSINITTGEIKEFLDGGKIQAELGINISKVSGCIAYWKDLDKVIKNTRRSYKDFIFVKSILYNPDFDYINYTKRKTPEIRKTWRDYNRNWKKSPEDLIPIEDRNLKRIPIIAVNIETGEELEFQAVLHTKSLFKLDKVWKVLKAPYGKYKHRGYYFRYKNKFGILK